MNKKKYKIFSKNKSIGTVSVRDDEELEYNLKGLAETKFIEESKYSDEYKRDSNNFSFILGTTGEKWEEDFQYVVSIFSRSEQNIVAAYNFSVEALEHEDKTHNKENSSCNLELQDYKNRQKRVFDNKVAHGFNTTNVYQEARYILEEVAELMRAVEKEDKENILEELADIVIFSYGCAAVAGVGDLDTKIFEKMQINENRVYTQNSEGDFIKKSK